jgi:hypothetical protein
MNVYDKGLLDAPAVVERRFAGPIVGHPGDRERVESEAPGIYEIRVRSVGNEVPLLIGVVGCLDGSRQG